MSNFNKVFCIGFNKTGTSSLNRLFYHLGLSSAHNYSWRPGSSMFRRYQAFSDGPPHDFAQLDRLFPRSKFILNIRPLEDWLMSRVAHVEMNRQDPKYKGTWVDHSPKAIEDWIASRDKHHKKVLDYFKRRPRQLLIVDYCNDPKANQKVAAFLGLSVPPEAQECFWRNRQTRARPPWMANRIGLVAKKLGLSAEDMRKAL